MKRPDLELALGSLALGLEPGAVLREVCPQCGGGSTSEKSLGLGISEEGYLWWKCHRASCGLSGKRLAWGVVQGPGAAPKKRPKGFTGALEALSDEHKGKFRAVFELDTPQNWRFAPEYARIYMPVWGPDYRTRGAILRNLPEDKRTPKTLTFKAEVEQPWMHWAGPDRDNPVIVEDMISAAKVQQSGITAVCILGTHLGLEKVREILRYTDQAVLALDKDAYSKATQYAVQYRHLINFEVWKLERDLKYVSEERIREAYFEKKTTFNHAN